MCELATYHGALMSGSGASESAKASSEESVTEYRDNAITDTITKVDENCNKPTHLSWLPRLLKLFEIAAMLILLSTLGGSSMILFFSLWGFVFLSSW